MRKRLGSPPEVNSQPIEGIITQVREYKLITPLFGGGAKAGETDPVTIIRGTEIRGQLRFWWRACRGGNYKTLEEMKLDEDKIWGAPSKKQAENKSLKDDSKKAEEVTRQKGTVQIAVEVVSEGTAVNPFTAEGRNVSHPYTTFPLQRTEEDIAANNPTKTIQNNVSFKLIISFPSDYKFDIEAALWAWETFGGIGARTRRGFGALCLLKIDNLDYVDYPHSQAKEVKIWLQKKLIQHVTEHTPPIGIPYLSRTLQIVVKPAQDVRTAWNILINKLFNFRQVPDGREGRSKWPEAETIRNITGQRYYKYPALPHPQKFPRSAFGLPIVFKFKDDNQGKNRSDPAKTTLQGPDKEHERLASPLILRPLTCKDRKAVGLAVLLEGPRTPPGELQLVEENKTSHSVEGKLTPQEAKGIDVLAGETDVLQAFMKYLERDR